MSELELYTNAIATRKAITKKMSGQVVNYAIVAQLEEEDIPRLLEIIRVQAKAISECIDVLGTDDDAPLTGEDADQMGITVSKAHLKVEELAEAGSKTKWGEYDGDLKQPS